MIILRPNGVGNLPASCGPHGLRMLRGNLHGMDPLRLHGTISTLQVLDGHLRPAVRPQPPEQATLTYALWILTRYVAMECVRHNPPSHRSCTRA